MATLRDIRNRIKGVQSTQKITKAMKMVSAAKLRRAQENIINARPYSNKLTAYLKNLVTEEQKQTNPYLVERELKNILVVVVTADRGLFGTFNTNIIRDATPFIDDDIKAKGASASLYCVGKKGYDHFRKRGYSIIGNKIGIFGSLKYSSAHSVADEVIKLFLSGSYDAVYVVYNEFKSIVSQKVNTAKYLPVPVAEDKSKPTHKEENYIYELSQQSIFEYVLPKYLHATMWRIFLESNAAEFGARMTAMDNATTNAKELIRTLRIKYNKERQASITKEILEIVSGANALKDNGG